MLPGGYVIDTARRLVLSYATGELSAEDVANHQQALANDPDFDPSFSQLSDFTQVTKFAIDAAQVISRAAENPFGPGARRAFVAPTAVGYGFSRMFQMLTDLDGPELAVFKTLAEAKAWLGLTE